MCVFGRDTIKVLSMTTKVGTRQIEKVVIDLFLDDDIPENSDVKARVT
jgi:hypothetical protein